MLDDPASRPRTTTAPLNVPPDVDQAVLVHVRPSRETAEHELKGEFVIGRSEGSLTIPDDQFLSSRHVAIRKQGDRYVVVDLESRNGTFAKVTRPMVLHGVTQIAIGSHMLRFYPTGRPGAGSAELVHVDQSGNEGESYLLSTGSAQIGRNEGNLKFPDDELVSDPHAEVSVENGGFTLRDLGSRTGTFVRIQGECILKDGDVFTAGQQVFRLTLGSG
jgi:predicted component of type VI protein secretion system